MSKTLQEALRYLRSLVKGLEIVCLQKGMMTSILSFSNPNLFDSNFNLRMPQRMSFNQFKMIAAKNAFSRLSNKSKKVVKVVPKNRNQNLKCQG